MILRSTSQVRVEQALAELRASSARQTALQQAITSGIRLQRPSDGPADYATVQETAALSQRLDTYLATAQSATSDLNESVSALQEVAQILNQATQIASQGISDSTDSNAFEALASQVDVLIDRTVTLGNTQANGRYLFGGTATQRAPFEVVRDTNGRPTQVLYQGSDERSRVLIGPGQSVDTRYAGNQVFQSPGGDIHQTLIALRDNLRDTSLDRTGRTAALTQRMSEIESARTAMLDVVGEQSASLENLDAVQNRIQEVHLTAQQRLNDLQATDFADAVVRLNEEQVLFQSTLAVTAKIFTGGGLLDFLR